VHFRSIKGHRNDFVAEVFPDDGEIDMVQAVRTYREIGYDGMLMPDHIPNLPGAEAHEKDEMFSFGYGYIRALIQATA
jgi:mannonate dehydratase